MSETHELKNTLKCDHTIEGVDTWKSGEVKPVSERIAHEFKDQEGWELVKKKSPAAARKAGDNEPPGPAGN